MSSDSRCDEIPNFDLFSGAFEELLDDSFSESTNKARTFVEETKLKKTTVKTESDLRKFKEFLLEKNVSTPIEDITPASLNAHLCDFIRELRPKNGQDCFEPTTIKGIVYSVERHLKASGYPDYQLTSSPTFSLLRDVMKAKMTISKAAGKGNRPQRAMPFSVEEEEELWRSKALGFSSPMALLRTLFWFMTMHFGLRGQHEHHQMLWEDVELKREGNGLEFLEFTERLTKTRRGTNAGRAFPPKMFPANDKTRCPIEAYKRYQSSRPKPKDGESCSKFYLAVNHQYQRTGNWFKNAPLGVNSIKLFMKQAANIAGIKEKKITNHSVRKTAVKRLLDNGCPPTYVAQLTGHKQVSSLASYTETCTDVQKKMAKTLLEKTPFQHAVPLPPTTTETVNESAHNSSFTTDALQQMARGTVVGRDFHSCTFTVNIQMK